MGNYQTEKLKKKVKFALFWSLAWFVLNERHMFPKFCRISFSKKCLVTFFVTVGVEGTI